MPKFDHPDLAKLDAATRATVEGALKETLERQLAAVGPLGGGAAAAHSRSQGAFFSRSKTTDQALGTRDVESSLLAKVTDLDDAQFAKFAGRLATIKAAAKGVK